MIKIDSKALSKQIKKYRERHKLTLIEFANKIPTTQNTVYRWEAGKSVPRSPLIIEKLQQLGFKV